MHDDDAWVPLLGFQSGIPIGCFPQWTQHNTEVTVKLQEKAVSWTGNDYKITTPDGELLFRMHGKALSMHSKKTMFDKNDHPILSISDKIMTFTRAFDIFAGESINTDRIAHVEGHWSITKTKMTVEFTNHHDKSPMKLEVVGNFWDRKAEITCDGQSVARIHRKFMTSGQIIADASTYYLTAAPGVDIALLVAVVVCMNEKANLKN